MDKVLFLSNHSGFSKFNKPYFDFLSKKGVKVYNAAPGIEVIADCVQIDVPISRNPLSLYNLLALFILIRRIKEENIINIHCHTPSGGVIGRLLKIFIPNLKVIYTSHGFHFYKGAPFRYWLIYFVIEFLLAPLTKAIITINDEDYHRSKKLLKRNTYKINGVGIDLTRFKPDDVVKKLGREKLKICEKSLVFIYTAQFIDRKNHIFLLKSFSKYVKTNPNAILLLLGSGPGEQRQKKLANDLNISKHIRFLGYKKNIEYYYQLSDIAVTVSKQEGLPMNVVESLATGLIVLASDSRGHRDIIKQSPGNHLFSLNDDSFFESLLKIDDKVINDLKQKRQNVKSAIKFDIDSSLGQMKNIYVREFNLNLIK